VDAAHGNLSWYKDPLPTNCVGDWVCAGGTGAGFPRHAHVESACVVRMTRETMIQIERFIPFPPCLICLKGNPKIKACQSDGLEKAHFLLIINHF
jgi:hypothetical protein